MAANAAQEQSKAPTNDFAEYVKYKKFLFGRTDLEKRNIFEASSKRNYPRISSQPSLTFN
jgi:hypothetical protein